MDSVTDGGAINFVTSGGTSSDIDGWGRGRGRGRGEEICIDVT